MRLQCRDPEYVMLVLKGAHGAWGWDLPGGWGEGGEV